MIIVLVILGMNLSVLDKACGKVSNFILNLSVCTALLCLMKKMTLIYWLSECLSGKWQGNQFGNFQRELEKHRSQLGLWRVWHREALARMCVAEKKMCFWLYPFQRVFSPWAWETHEMSALEFDTICQAMGLPSPACRIPSSPRPPRDGSSLLSVLSGFLSFCKLFSSLCSHVDAS